MALSNETPITIELILLLMYTVHAQFNKKTQKMSKRATRNISSHQSYGLPKVTLDCIHIVCNTKYIKKEYVTKKGDYALNSLLVNSLLVNSLL